MTGVITGAACALIAATLMFIVYFASLPANEAEASEKRPLTKVTSAPVAQEPEAEEEEIQGVFSVPNNTMLEKLEYIKEMINNYSLYGASEEEMLDGMYRGLLWYYERDGWRLVRTSLCTLGRYGRSYAQTRSSALGTGEPGAGE